MLKKAAAAKADRPSRTRRRPDAACQSGDGSDRDSAGLVPGDRVVLASGMVEEFHSSEQGVAAATGVPTIATSMQHCRFPATIVARYSSIFASGKNRESAITARSCDGRQPGRRASGRNPFPIGLRAGQGRRHRSVERQRVPGINACPVDAALGQISTAGGGGIERVPTSGSSSRARNGEP